MNNLIPHIDLLNGLNMNPISLEASQSMTTTKWLMAIQAKLNTIIDLSNGTIGTTNNYTDEKFKVLQAEYDNLLKLLNNGDIIPNGSISLSKLEESFFTNLRNIATEYVHKSAKFVTFGLDDNGNFISYIPSTWEDIVFSTSEIGELLLDLKEV